MNTQPTSTEFHEIPHHNSKGRLVSGLIHDAVQGRSLSEALDYLDDHSSELSVRDGAIWIRHQDGYNLNLATNNAYTQMVGAFARWDDVCYAGQRFAPWDFHHIALRLEWAYRGGNPRDLTPANIKSLKYFIRQLGIEPVRDAMRQVIGRTNIESPFPYFCRSCLNAIANKHGGRPVT